MKEAISVLLAKAEKSPPVKTYVQRMSHRPRNRNNDLNPTDPQVCDEVSMSDPVLR